MIIQLTRMCMYFFKEKNSCVIGIRQIGPMPHEIKMVKDQKSGSFFLHALMFF
jgi:hypothetical protein